MLRNVVLMALMVGFVSCAPGMGSTTNQSKNPYVAARYEPLSRIKVKPGETTYATVSYNPQYLDGDFSKVVERAVKEPEYPKEGDVYAGQIHGMLDVMSVTPKENVEVSIAYVEARREIRNVTVTKKEYFDDIQYKYIDSIEVTYKITVNPSDKYISGMRFLEVSNNYKNSRKSIMLMLDIEGQALEDLFEDLEPEQPEAPKSENK